MRKIHQLLDFSSRSLCLIETVSIHFLLGQIQYVEEDSILDLLVQETSVHQRATNVFLLSLLVVEEVVMPF